MRFIPQAHQVAVAGKEHGAAIFIAIPPCKTVPIKQIRLKSFWSLLAYNPIGLPKLTLCYLWQRDVIFKTKFPTQAFFRGSFEPKLAVRGFVKLRSVVLGDLPNSHCDFPLCSVGGWSQQWDARTEGNYLSQRERAGGAGNGTQKSIWSSRYIFTQFECKIETRMDENNIQKRPCSVQQVSNDRVASRQEEQPGYAAGVPVDLSNKAPPSSPPPPLFLLLSLHPVTSPQPPPRVLLP